MLAVRPGVWTRMAVYFGCIGDWTSTHAMLILAHITFYAGIAGYAASALAALHYLREPDERDMTLANRMMAAGAFLVLTALTLRGIHYGLMPLTTAVDAIMLLLILSSAIIAVLMRDPAMRPLQCYYAPPLAVVALLVALANAFGTAEAPKPLHGLFVTVHVGLAFLSYALFLIASLTSVAYFVQVWRLKRMKPSGLFHKMPPLEVLETRLYRLILTGYPLFVITLILGAVWATTYAQESLSARWWLSPKIIFSLVTAVFYASVVHARQFGWLRGRRFAQFLFYGYALVILSYLATGLLHLRDYNFWETGL